MKPNDLLPSEFADATGRWDQFFSWARTRRGFAFRGQANETWPVWSSYHRYMDAIGNTSEEETMLEPDSDYLVDLHVVAHELYPELEQEFDLQDPKQRSEFLSIAQHHGFPTPLIDFTDSPFIAAYFAVRDAKDGELCRIFCVNLVALQIAIGGNKATQVNFARPLARHNPRIAVQQGLFILSLKSDLLRHLVHLQDYITRNIYQHPSRALEKPLVGGFLLTVTNRAEILSDLDLMGINEYTLFGGLDGAFRHCKWKHLPEQKTRQPTQPTSNPISPS
jgi:FRG domain